MNLHYNDDELIAGIKNGSEAAFKLLFDSFHMKIYTVSRKMGMLHDEAEDVIQDTFLQLWKQKEAIKEELSLRGLIYTIAKRIVLKKLEENKHYYDIDNIESEIIIGSNKTQEDLCYSETNTLVKNAINTLTEQQRLIFSLNYNKGLSAIEISQKLNVSKRAVENQIFRARKQLRSLLASHIIPSILFLLFCYWNEYL